MHFRLPARLLLYTFLATIIFGSCQRNPLKIDISGVSYQLNIVRLDSAMFETDTAAFIQNLTQWRTQWPFFFGAGTDQFWKTQRKDPAQNKLYKDISQVFGNLEKQKQDLESMLRHFYYYYPENTEILVAGYLSNLDFDFPIIFADSLLFVALDLYLGAHHPAYAQLPQYLADKRKPEYLVRDAAESIIKSMIEQPAPDRPFIEELIYQGKVLYMIKALMPTISNEVLFQYEPDALAFCESNERMIWNYFIDNELLFDTSLDPKRRFIFPAPFSKFRTSFDNQTPGSIGKWVGYQIVAAYMDKADQSAAKLLNHPDPLTLFKNSKYKPK
jgi:hypothetical protein